MLLLRSILLISFSSDQIGSGVWPEGHSAIIVQVSATASRLEALHPLPWPAVTAGYGRVIDMVCG
jgi:hypothetical protein